MVEIIDSKVFLFEYNTLMMTYGVRDRHLTLFPSFITNVYEEEKGQI